MCNIHKIHNNNIVASDIASIHVVIDIRGPLTSFAALEISAKAGTDILNRLRS